MSKRIDVEVVIGGNQYTISGEEGSEYIQKIAAHINAKLAEFKKQDGYAGLDMDMKNILLAINLSDDYYKAMQELQDVKAENEEKEKELFDMKHELISMQSRMGQLTEEADKLKVQQNEEEHSVIRMEAKYEQASRNEEKSRLELTRLEKRLKLIQDSEQRAQAKQKELELALEEQKKLVQELTEQNQAMMQKQESSEEKDNLTATEEEETTEQEKTVEKNESAELNKPEEVGKEIAASMGKPQNRKASRSSRARRR